MKRVKVAIEPVLHIHRYVLAFYPNKGTCKYFYCANRKEVREKRKELFSKASPVAYLEVFKAGHDFQEAWVKA